MKKEEIEGTILEAFSNAKWPHDGASKPTFSSTECDDLISDLNTLYPEAIEFVLPQLLIYAISISDEDSRLEALNALIHFLNADFFDPKGVNSLLKEARMNVFSNYTKSESRAVYEWILYVQVCFSEKSLDRKELDSALPYWGKKKDADNPRDR